MAKEKKSEKALTEEQTQLEKVNYCKLGDGRMVEVLDAFQLNQPEREITIQVMKDDSIGDSIIGITINRPDINDYQKQNLLLTQDTFSFLMACMSEADDRYKINAFKRVENYLSKNPERAETKDFLHTDKTDKKDEKPAESYEGNFVLPKVKRVEIIDPSLAEDCRKFVKRNCSKVELSYQDDGSTLKIFVR